MLPMATACALATHIARGREQIICFSNPTVDERFNQLFSQFMIIKVRVGKEILKWGKLHYIKTASGHGNSGIIQTDLKWIIMRFNNRS